MRHRNFWVQTYSGCLSPWKASPWTIFHWILIFRQFCWIYNNNWIDFLIVLLKLTKTRKYSNYRLFFGTRHPITVLISFLSTETPFGEVMCLAYSIKVTPKMNSVNMLTKFSILRIWSTARMWSNWSWHVLLQMKKYCKFYP